MRSFITRTTKAVALLGVVALTATACSPDDQAEETPSPAATPAGETASLTIMSNAISGGKNAAEAEWIQDWVIPNFVEAQLSEGIEVSVSFEPQGVDDEAYKTKVALDLSTGGGADIISLDGIWIGEFAQAGYIKPLEEVTETSNDWEGWDQITEAVQASGSFEGERYGVPQGTDGRVIYYNKELFEQAGLPTEWHPASWEEILEAGRALKELDGVTPIQLNAGTAMGEATTMQGLLPMLMGTGERLYEDGQWFGDTEGLRAVLDLYRTIYVEEELGDPILQQEASGRDTSFQEFAAGNIAILLEGDYFWRSVINPAEGVGTAPMEDRDTVVGYTRIPALEPGAGVNGQDFVSMSGGASRVLNPNSENPDLAWDLLAFMNSPEAFEARAAGTLSISPRTDVNEKLLASDPMLSYVNEEILPITFYRPGLASYPEVSLELQQATLDVISGEPVEEVSSSFAEALASIVGAENVARG